MGAPSRGTVPAAGRDELSTGTVPGAGRDELSAGTVPGAGRDDAIVVRPAEPRDDAARCALFARVAMEAELGLSVDRAPDFDALYRLQARDWVSVVVERGGAIEGTGTILVRDGYIGGAVRRVGYLGDLRLSPRVQGRLLLDRFYGALLESVRDRFGCELFLTAVIATNEAALRALTARTRRSRKARRPVYTPVGDFDIRSLHLLAPRRRPASPFPVRRAAPADIPALARLLDADARRRPFGYVFTEEELRRRLAEWPGLAAESFLIAEGPDGAPAGCLAPWDAAPVKRTVVTSYRGSMRRVRLGYDLAATLLRRDRLPRPGEAFRYRYVTHQAVPSDDPRVLRVLLDAAYREARAAGDHFLSVCAPEAGPLEPALRGFHATSLRARLFVVSLPDVDVAPVASPAHWPGFEMALV